MKRRLLRCLTVVAFISGGVGHTAALTAREIIDTAQEKNGLSTWRDRTLDTTMESYTTTLQRTRDANVSEQTDPRGEHRTYMEFTGPTDVIRTRFLHLSPRGDADQQWLWSPQTRRARRLPDSARDENFMGTDLSYRDLELIVRIQQWNDRESAATLLPDETAESRKCHVVELVPKNDEFPYSKYRLWFGAEDLLLWRVEVYDPEGRLFKRVALRNYARIENYATAHEAEIANVQAGTHTLFKVRNVAYDTNVSEDLFTLANVQRGN